MRGFANWFFSIVGLAALTVGIIELVKMLWSLR